VPRPSWDNFTLYADLVSRRMYPDDDVRRDAARHMLASALAARSFGPGAARALGGAYELKESPLRTLRHWFGLGAPRADYPVDMHNNALGIELQRVEPRRPDAELLRAIERAIAAGAPSIAPGRVALVPDADTQYYAPPPAAEPPQAKRRGGLAQVKECSCHGR
jgi:hypothetical protein